MEAGGESFFPAPGIAGRVPQVEARFHVQSARFAGEPHVGVFVSGVHEYNQSGKRSQTAPVLRPTT
jgi:hypothetical protein